MVILQPKKLNYYVFNQKFISKHFFERGGHGQFISNFREILIKITQSINQQKNQQN